VPLVCRQHDPRAQLQEVQPLVARSAVAAVTLAMGRSGLAPGRLSMPQPIFCSLLGMAGHGSPGFPPSQDDPDRILKLAMGPGRRGKSPARSSTDVQVGSWRLADRGFELLVEGL